MLDLPQLCSQVVDLAITVADFIQAEAKHFTKDKVEYKQGFKPSGTHNLVSYVDKLAEEQIVAGLSIIFPSAGFLTEEETVVQAENEYRWVIDPLDGTTNFVHHLPIYAISIALQKDDTVLLGVIYEPNRKECFYAWQGGGAFLNKLPIRVSDTKHLSHSVVSTGFAAYTFSESDLYLNTFRRLAYGCQGIRHLGAAAVDLAYVACGRLEAYFEYKLKPWDVAAGMLIVQEAGGNVTNFSGNKQGISSGNKILATNRLVHDELLRLMHEEGLS